MLFVGLWAEDSDFCGCTLDVLSLLLFQTDQVVEGLLPLASPVLAAGSILFSVTNFPHDLIEDAGDLLLVLEDIKLGGTSAENLLNLTFVFY